MTKKMVLVRTVPVLLRVHAAFRQAAKTGDPSLEAAANSVLSALVVVLRHEEARIPAELLPYMEKLPGG